MSAAVAESGVVTRMETCQKHGRQYPQIFFRSWPAGFWSGCCSVCASEEKLKQRADEFLRSKHGEIVSEATKIIQQREHQTAIEKRTKKDLDAEMAKQRKEQEPLWKEYNTNLEWNQVVCEIEDRKRTEFLEQLKKGA